MVINVSYILVNRQNSYPSPYPSSHNTTNKDEGLSAHPLRLEPHTCLHRKTVMCSCLWAMCVVINNAKLCLPMNLYTLKYKYKSIYIYIYIHTTICVLLTEQQE